MEFHTKIDIPAFDFGISYASRCIFVGSCFAENIGNKLTSTKFHTSVNPTGILYNPLSICKSIKNALSGKKYGDNDVFFSGGTWNCFDFHSRFSKPERASCVDGINVAVKTLADEIRNADVMFVTFGTAYVYELAESGKVVCNCHKQPEKDFTRHLLKVDEIVDSWTECINSLMKTNPKLRIVFTVSPIRHWRDGAHLNQISKSTLLLAINELNNLFPQTSYFPAYEIVMDELRDYRFYATDMVHPSETAVQYIWERFGETFFSEQTKANIARIGKIIAAANHRPVNPQSDEYKLFCKKNLDEIERIKTDIGEVDFREEEGRFEGSGIL
ncbi:MAG: GSCFA domain-containing protein [Bacteroidales bacterium]|nr:GSCFA domain-containing protein [Bacteroidales bacterium]